MLLQKKIKLLRKKKNFSQGELAKKVGISAAHLSRLENGMYNPSVEVLKKLSENLEVDVNYLLDEKDANSEIKLENCSVAEKIRLIESLDPKDKDVLFHIINSFLNKKRILTLLNQELPN